MTKSTDEKQGVFELIQGLTRVDPQQLAEFKRRDDGRSDSGNRQDRRETASASS